MLQFGSVSPSLAYQKGPVSRPGFSANHCLTKFVIHVGIGYSDREVGTAFLGDAAVRSWICIVACVFLLRSVWPALHRNPFGSLSGE
jgi:hypothetical protein